MVIDLNADLGEGAAFDDALMTLITSANVCCGAHAGGPADMERTLDMAGRHRVVVGAHPGYPDRASFGRLERDYPRQELASLVRDQLARFQAMARAKGLAMAYVKPHGALYNQACRDRHIAEAVVEVVAEYGVPLVGLPGSQLEAACRSQVAFVPEGFADRRYQPDGSLAPRTVPDAFIHDPAAAVAQVEWLIQDRGVRTICVHGDNPEAVTFARAVRASLELRGIELKSFA